MLKQESLELKHYINEKKEVGENDITLHKRTHKKARATHLSLAYKCKNTLTKDIIGSAKLG